MWRCFWAPLIAIWVSCMLHGNRPSLAGHCAWSLSMVWSWGDPWASPKVVCALHEVVSWHHMGWFVNQTMQCIQNAQCGPPTTRWSWLRETCIAFVDFWCAMPINGRYIKMMYGTSCYNLLIMNSLTKKWLIWLSVISLYLNIWRKV